MLQAIREKVVGWMIWVVLLLVGVPFAFWGVDSFFLGGGDPVVVKVGDRKIHESQLRAAYENRYQQLQQMLGENFRADLFDKKKFEQAVLDEMIQQETLRQFTQNSGYRAGDAMVYDTLKVVPAFQKDGKFSADAYREALSSRGMDPTSFEAQVRESVQQEQLREGVLQTAFITPAEAERVWKLQNQERAVSYAVLDLAQYRSRVTPTPEQVKARYEADKAQYMSPERIRLAYVELSLDTLPKAANPGADVLRVIYEAEKNALFTTQEERKAQHILLSFGADKDAAKKRIDALVAELKAGKDFSELARVSSEDSGSKASGGDLGWVRRGQMVKAFENALFDLKPGTVSAPVETEFGWHLIKVNEAKPSVTRPFEDAAVQAQLLEIYQTRDVQKRFTDQQEKLEQLAFENPGSLDVVAKELGLPVQTTDWLTRAGGAGIAAETSVKDAAFSTEIVTDGENSKPLPVGDNRVVVIRKAEYEAARQKPLEEVAVLIQDAVVRDLALALAQKDADDIIQQSATQPFHDAVTGKGFTTTDIGLVKRDNAGTDKAILDALFRLPRPAAGGAARVGKTLLGTGNIALIALREVRDPQWSADAADSAAVSAQQRDLRAGAEFGSYKKVIEQSIKVKRAERKVEEETEPVAP